jgi:tRNA A-37 threonylcarbamoyl transferase component Bud32
VSWAAAGWPGDFVAAIWRRVDESTDGKRFVLPLPAPAEGKAHVKIVRARAGHSWWRRLGTSRVAHEWRGFREFAARGVRVPELVAFGEERRLRLHRVSFLATRYVDALNLNRAHAAAPDRTRVVRAAEELAAIHAVGLCHGDPRMRNFLDTAPRPMTFDLASWSEHAPAAQRRDLVRFLGSAWLLMRDEALLDEVVTVWEAKLAKLPVARAQLRDEARRWSDEEERP